MAETPQDSHRPPQILYELPVEVTPGRAIEVGDYFAGLLESFGTKTKIPIGGKHGVYEWDGILARFDWGDTAFVVQHIDRPDPSIDAYFTYKTRKGGFTRWNMGDTFRFDLKDQTLHYRHGGTLVYAYTDQPLPEGVSGVQRWGKRGGLTANVTPPNPEGVITLLDNFLVEGEEFIKNSRRLSQRLKRHARFLGAAAKKLIVGI